MALESRPPEHHSDGGTTSETPGLRRAAWVLVLVTLVVGLGTFLVIMLFRGGGSASQPPTEATQRPEPTSAGERMTPPAATPAHPSEDRPRAVRHAAAPSPTGGAAAPPAPDASRDVSAQDVSVPDPEADRRN